MYENRIYEGVPAVLDGLAKGGCRLYVATVKPTVFAQRVVEHFGLDQWLSRTYGSELDGTRMDKVDLLRHLIEEERLDPGASVMVGDRHNDMEAARYHGIRAIGALWGYGSREELLEAGAEVLLRLPGELISAV
jgi:phosphoglycolate phosphatase